MRRKLKSILALILAAVSLLAVLPLSVSAATCSHRFGGYKWADATHPHEHFYYCEKGCGAKQYTGTYMNKSNCGVCNPSIRNCPHTNTWQSDHPHELVCTGCCKVVGYGTDPSCPDCCSHSGYYFTESTHQSGGYHERYLHCNKCGNDIYKSNVYNLSSCVICNPPVTSSVSLSASGPTTTIYSSGIIEATSVPASFSVSANCSGCYVTSMYYYVNGRKVSSSSGSISYTASDYSEFQSITVYVTTNTGLTDSITVNFTYARYADASIKWEYTGAVIRSVSQNGRTIKSGLSTSIDFEWNGTGLSDSAYDTVAGLVGAYDGKSYLLSGSSVIRVYAPNSNKTLGIYDTYSDYDSLCSCAGWTAKTLNAFTSCKTLSISYQAPNAVNGSCTWETDTGTVLHSTTAAAASGRSYVKPNESITVSYRSSDYTPSGYVFQKMIWSCGSDTGESASKQSYSKLYNYQTAPVNVRFIYTKAVTSGSIKVTVRDGDTNAIISGASVTCGGKSQTGNPASFTGLKLGTYTVSASASGYDSASGSYTITSAKPDISVTLYLYKNSGNVTVFVSDSATGKPISGASITGAASGMTDSTGKRTFYGIPLFTTQSFTASASGYSSGSGSVTLTRTNPGGVVNIYLDPIPTTGSITVTVYDANTNRAISGATVCGCGTNKTTGNGGSVTFYDVSYGSYSFSASASGYYSGSGNATISLGNRNDSVSIYLTPIPTSGDITVVVKDYDTGAVIPGASVSGASTFRTTNTYGKAYFHSLPFGSYVFSASASGYDSSSGSGTISVDSTLCTVTIYLLEQKTDLTVDASVNGTIYQGSTIMVSATIGNSGDVDLTPSNPATVTMTAKQKDGTVFSTQTNAVICPAYGSNLTWFTVTIPQTDAVTFSFTVAAPSGVSESNLSNNNDTLTAPVYTLPNRSCIDSGLELETPPGFNYSQYKGKSNPTRSWTVYEWNNGFVKKTYSAKLTLNAALTPDESAGYRALIGGIWTTRSGYGVNTELKTTLSGQTADVVGTLKADTFYPEFNYAVSTNKTDRLELINGSYVFKPNSASVDGRRFHPIPLWFPDKAYAVKYMAYDLWCPAGMLSGYTSAYVNIDGDMYDDLYTN